MSEEQQALREALKKTAVALKEAGVPFALGGGYGGWALGGPEPEHDVDFVIAQHDAERAERALAEAGLRVEHPPEDWLFKVFDGTGDDAPMVDLIYRPNGRPVEGDLLDRAVLREVLSVQMPVVSPTDLLVTKALALSEHACDLSKVLPDARSLREQIDWARVSRELADNHYAVAFLFLLNRLGVADVEVPDADAPAAPSPR